MDGIIYRITFANGKSYIGQTIQTLTQRWQKHQSAARRNKTGGCALLNAALRKYGATDCKLETLLICNVEQLDLYEDRMIDCYNTLAPNGYNLITGGNSNKQMSQQTRAKMSASARERDTTNYRRVPEALDLPKYLLYFCNDRYEGYKISKHPNCESKYFTDSQMTMGEKLTSARAFLAELDAGMQIAKKVRTLPNGIQKYQNGYRIHYIPPGCKKRVIKNFNSRQATDEQNLQNAIDYLEILNDSL